MVLINFAKFGPVPPRLVLKPELRAIYTGAQNLLADYSWEEVEHFIKDWEIALMWTSRSEQDVTDEWYTRALIIMCLRGLMGQIRPEFTWFTD
jgi:hypothetical protein